MQPVPPLCLVLIVLLPGVLPSSAEPGLPAPSNVRIDSYNMKHVVRWDPVEVKDEPMPVMYSVEFEMHNEIRELCTNITETECDFTGKILPFFRGKPKVRAELGARKSEWVVLPNFQPSKNMTIGPVQSLVLHSRSGKLTVDFSPPFSPIPSGWTMTYNLYYWKENSEKKNSVDPSSSTTYLLDNLEANVNYCVQVYASTHYIKGLMSDPVCEITNTDFTLIVVLGCVFGFVFIFGVVSLLVIPDKPIHKAISGIKNWLDGPYRIPSHVLEYLEDPPPLIVVECNPNTFDDHYDHISIAPVEFYKHVNEESSPDHSQPSSEKT
ncbi:interferon gamma receptor 2 isoform 2-T2 [Mantella aurantiaca]